MSDDQPEPLDDVSHVLERAKERLDLAIAEWEHGDSYEARKHMRRARFLLADAFELFQMYERQTPSL